MARIGVDFDNTIARYDELFEKVALSQGAVGCDWSGKGKTALRNRLREQPGGELVWMRLQGLVYGKYMHLAAMMPGVARFLVQCRLRGCEVFIVSHKTEYGHFDSEKVSLRREAMKWMEARGFFDPQRFCLEERSVFFADTREAKAERISQLDCDFFIDDLPEVFAEPKFPDSTQKILLGNAGGLSANSQIVSLGDWEMVSSYLFDSPSMEDVKHWACSCSDQAVQIEKVVGRGNSRMYRLLAEDGNRYALKVYPESLSDPRPRLETEFRATELLRRNGFGDVPDAISRNDEFNVGVYSWIDGVHIGSPDRDDVATAIDFVGRLHALSKRQPGCFDSLASEACLSAASLISQIEVRKERLDQAVWRFPSLATFLSDVFLPIWQRVKSRSLAEWPSSSRSRDLDVKYRILSPSDFGFHNALRRNGEMTFVDFEYFGWDDPSKLTADFIWHPGMDLGAELVAIWEEAMLDLFSDDPDFGRRLRASMPLYGMRWAMILLNEFLPEYSERRKGAGDTGAYDEDRGRRIQLTKATDFCRLAEKIGAQ